MSSSFVTNSNHLIDLNSGANTLSITGAVAITGNLSVTGNSTFSGNILGNRIQNGTSNINIATANGSITVTANTGNTWTFDTGGNLTFPTGMIVDNESPNTRIYQTSGSLKIRATTTASLRLGWDEFTGANVGGNVAQIIMNGTAAGQQQNVIVRTGNSSSTTYQWIFDASGNLSVPGTISAVGNITGGNISTAGVVKTGVFVTGNIPTAAGVGAGARAFVTDANSGTFGNLYVGGAANAMPVWSNGTSWYVG
jgi:hypothetical protein